jgi:hypothetical protein
MFPGHIIKMEQLHEHLKQTNNNNQLHNNSNSKLKASTNENNNVNYVTISFNRNLHNKNLNDKIMHSHSYYKQRLINHSLKPKIKTINANNKSEASKTKIQQGNNISNYKNIKSKNRSKNRISYSNKNNFELPIPVNTGKNILIKHFFKDLENYSNNMNEIANNLTDANNKTNKNLYNNYSKKESASTENYESNSLTTSSKDLYPEKKVNTLSNTYNEKQMTKNIMLKNHQKNLNDLPFINSRKMLKDLNTGDVNLNTSPQLEVKNENIKNDREKNKKIKNKNNKNISNDKFDKSRTIENYKRVLSINTIMNDDFSKNVNNNNTLTIKIPSITIKDNLKNNVRQKTSNETSNKANSGTIIGNGIKLRLPNVLNKTDVHIKKDNNKTGKNTNITINSNIVLKTEKTVLKKKNKNPLPISAEKFINSQNEQKQLETEGNIISNTVVINSWDENAVVEEQKPIRLREKININNPNANKNNICQNAK